VEALLQPLLPEVLVELPPLAVTPQMRLPRKKRRKRVCLTQRVPQPNTKRTGH